MKVSQVATLINSVTSELIGESAVINEDLSNVVDIGKAIFDNTSYDNFVRTLVDHIGRVIFVDRVYTGNTLAIKRDSWEYGSVLEKLSAGIPDAIENDSWELQDQASYPVDVFTKPKDVEAKFYDKRITFEIPLSIADKQVKSAFSSATQLNAFVSMLWGMVDKSMTLKLEGLASRLVNNMIATTVNASFPSVADNDYSGKTSVKAINLLYEYNTDYGLTGTDALTKDNCLLSENFLKYASLKIEKTLARLTRMSTLFNIQGKPRFTPKELQHLILLSDFKAASDVMLQSGVFHDQYTALPNATEVPYWQGSGTGYGLSSVANVHVEIPVGGSTKEINVGYVLGCAFDHDALMLACLDERTTSFYNAAAEFSNYWRKVDCGLFSDDSENFVLWYVA